ncbi:MAG: hypothetical protein K2K59_00125, partial [Muribaculaceae bacterium]|nr:hypothetical protein [Muribaculaceae bacterium]
FYMFNGWHKIGDSALKKFLLVIGVQIYEIFRKKFVTLWLFKHPTLQSKHENYQDCAHFRVL